MASILTLSGGETPEHRELGHVALAVRSVDRKVNYHLPSHNPPQPHMRSLHPLAHSHALPSFALLSEWLQGWCPTPQLSQAAAGAVGTSWPLCLTGWIHGMNSLCAAAVLVLPVQSLLLLACLPSKEGLPLLVLCNGIPCSSSQTLLCFNAGLLLPCTFLNPCSIPRLYVSCPSVGLL